MEAIGSGKGGDYSKAPKTTSSRRIVPVAPKLAKILERRRDLMLAEPEAAGADVKAVSSILGHSNAAMTFNVYADADPESKRRASELVEQAALAESGGGLALARR